MTMNELMTYALGFWTGRVDVHDLNRLWADTSGPQSNQFILGSNKEDHLDRLFPNGWHAGHFTPDQAKARVQDPELVKDLTQVWTLRTCPPTFGVDMDQVLACLEDDPNVVGEWSGIDGWGFFEKTVTAGWGKGKSMEVLNPAPVALVLNTLSPMGNYESALEYELDQAGADVLESMVDEEILADLVRVHLPDFHDHDNLPTYGPRYKGLPSMGFIWFHGVISVGVEWEGGGGGWSYEDPPEPDYLVPYYQGRVLWDTQAVQTSMDVTGPTGTQTHLTMDLVRPGEDTAKTTRSILD